jgi:hypothetical protein
MFITHSYLGTTRGSYRCLFFLLLKDYIQQEADFVRRLEPGLERFARQLGDQGAVVRAFKGDIENTRQHVLDKPWSNRQLRAITKTPSILMIDQDFDVFDPNEHTWVLLHFGEEPRHLNATLAHETTLERLAEAVVDPETDVFGSARALVDQATLHDGVDLIEAKPGIFGFSVDLVGVVRFIAGLREGRNRTGGGVQQRDPADNTPREM